MDNPAPRRSIPGPRRNVSRICAEEMEAADFPRQVLHEVVDRLQTILRCCDKQPIQSTFALSREQRDSERERLLQLGGHLGKHRDATTDVKPADGNLDSRGPQLP